MRQIVRKIFIPPLVSTSILVSASIFGGCASLDTVQSTLSQNVSQTTYKPATRGIDGIEQAGLVPAAQFLSHEWMQGTHHSVEPDAYNDGYSNIYRINTDKHVYVVRGTQNAKSRIHEIQATNILRERSTLGTAANAATGRVTNLVETPVRALQGGAKRFAQAETAGDKFMVIPSGVVDVIGNLGSGLKELAQTGLRITTSAAGTKCSGLGCVGKAGEDLWSGFNSLAGKHAAAREIHKSVRTDPYTDNKVLQREVSRLAYADAYTSTSVKFGLTMSGIQILDPAATFVGYYNNAEFISIYEDAHKRRDREKNQLRSWGVEDDIIIQLYTNKAFTHTSRTRLAQTLQKIGNESYRARLIGQAATTKTKYIAQSRLAVYQYLASLDQNGDVKGYVSNAPSAIAITNDNILILPFSADYLKWTADIQSAVKNFATLATQSQRTEIHILGKASPHFKNEAKKLGIKIREIS